MKKSIVTMMIACMAMSGWAKEMPKAGFGLQFGFAQPIVRANSTASTKALTDTHLNGLKVGLVYDASYVLGFGSTIGLNYTYANSHDKWSKIENGTYSFSNFSDRKMYTYHQLELFVDWQYKFEVAKELYVILYTGPSMQCGLNYKERYEKRNDALKQKMKDECTNVDHFDTDDRDAAMRRINITWGVGIGLQFQRYFLRGGYDFGLVNPYSHNTFTDGTHTRGRIDQWNIRAGVYLWYK